MINRKYLIDKIKEHTNEEKIMYACKKLSFECHVDYMTIYRFAKFAIPIEENLIKILRTLQLDCNVLFLSKNLEVLNE